MAKIHELNQPEWDEWVAARPESIRRMCHAYPPNLLYRMGDSRHRCTIYSYHENGKVTVSVTGQYNAVAFARNVFGIDPESLVECDLPGDDEVLGEVCTQTEAVDLMAFIKQQMRRH